MKHFHPLLLLLPAFFLSACGERKADVERLKSFDRKGLTFQYPGNWKVTDTWFVRKGFIFFAESPGDSFVTVEGMPTKDAGPLKDYAKDFAAQQDIDSAVVKFRKKSIKADGGGGLEEKVVLLGLGQSIPYTRHYTTLAFGDHTVYIVSCYPDEDAGKVEPGFAVIKRSLVWKPKAKVKKKKEAKPDP